MPRLVHQSVWSTIYIFRLCHLRENVNLTLKKCIYRKPGRRGLCFLFQTVWNLMQPHRLGPQGQVTNMLGVLKQSKLREFCGFTHWHWIHICGITHSLAIQSNRELLSYMNVFCLHWRHCPIPLGFLVYTIWLSKQCCTSWKTQLLEPCLSNVSWKLSCSVLLDNFWLGFCKKIRLPYLSFCVWIKNLSVASANNRITRETVSIWSWLRKDLEVAEFHAYVLHNIVFLYWRCLNFFF